MTRVKALPVTIIGAGGVGSALALSLHQNKVSIRAIFSKKGDSAKRLGKRVHARKTGAFRAGCVTSGIIIIAVPDDEIAAAVRTLRSRPVALSGSTILHTSGALSSAALLPLKKMGAAVGSFHPLQTFPKKLIGSASLRGLPVAVEGDSGAVRMGRKIARAIGAHPFAISSRQKVLYHIAAVFGSNYFVTLLSSIEELGRHIGFRRQKMIAMLEPIILQSLKNVKISSAAAALTGPIARGDLKTVNMHLDALRSRNLKDISDLYSALARATTRLAARKIV